MNTLTSIKCFFDLIMQFLMLLLMKYMQREWYCARMDLKKYLFLMNQDFLSILVFIIPAAHWPAT